MRPEMEELEASLTLHKAETKRNVTTLLASRDSDDM